MYLEWAANVIITKETRNAYIILVRKLFCVMRTLKNGGLYRTIRIVAMFSS